MARLLIPKINIPKVDVPNITQVGTRARKRKLTPADKKRVAAEQNWKCKKCKRMLPARYHIDHIKEYARGGSDKESNLQ